MMTARKALDLGRPVAALPGPPLSPLFAGNLQLIYDGAFLLRDGADLALFLQSLKGFVSLGAEMEEAPAGSG